MMIGLKTKVLTYNFYKKTIGQRNTPYQFFYLFPMCTISRTKTQEKFSLHLGWLFWSLHLEKLK